LQGVLVRESGTELVPEKSENFHMGTELVPETSENLHMGTELVPETSENHILTRRPARENFFEFRRRESCKTCNQWIA